MANTLIATDEIYPHPNMHVPMYSAMPPYGGPGTYVKSTSRKKHKERKPGKPMKYRKSKKK